MNPGREPGASSYGLAYTSYAVRMLQGRDIMQATAAALPAAAFVDLCAEAGGSGCQIDLSQLDTSDAAGLSRLRDRLDALDFFVELSAPAASIATGDGLNALTAVTRILGVSHVRVALLMGRRYESFPSMDAWAVFASTWRATLAGLAPAIEDSGLVIGIENHKDWLASELADLLGTIGSPSLGACVDFGNNLALLEDPLTVARRLAPFVVTTHVKDMAVRATTDGFEMAEVPLGQGTLPLAPMIGVLRAERPDVRLILEMITRDPLPVPMATELYWRTRRPHERAGAEAFASSLLATSNGSPLPRTTGLAPADAVALEDRHNRACTEYARHTLGL